MRRLSSCLRPSIFAVTVPPPEEASTIVSCIFFCRVSYCDFAFDINSCRLNPPMVALPLLLVIDYRANLGAEFLLQAPDDWVLLGAAAASRTRAIGLAAITLRLRGRDSCAGNNSQL